MLKKDFYFLSPVEVVKVTTQNLQEVAEWCGGQVATTESRRVPGRQDSYVWVPTPKGTAISWAFPGMFITKRLVRTVKDDIRVTYAVFRRDYFEKNYFESPTSAVAQTWEKGMKTPNTPKKGPKPPKNLDIKVSVPPGASAEEVKEAVDVAVDVLQEQGMISKPDPEGILSNSAPSVPTLDSVAGEEKILTERVEDVALQAIASSDSEAVFPGNDQESPTEVPTTEVAQTASPKEVHNEQIELSNPGTPETEKDGVLRELVPDHELRQMGLPTSYQEDYKPVYRDEVPTDVTLS